MSGIAGVYNIEGRPVEASTMEAMTKALDHRGPDGSGVWIDGSVGFAHVMLWTTPESLTEKQPLLDASGQLVITADARIDNRDDLIRSLDLNGRADLSDSELILYAYSKWGECCPEKLVGDFAFAIWDKRKRTLFAARDRIGLKPFYYHHMDGRGFVFASEIAPIFDATNLEKRPDREAIDELLFFRQLAYNRTLFCEIQRLPPACVLSTSGGAVAVRKFWEPQPNCCRRSPRLEEDAEEFLQLFATAIQAQMRSAFPIGCLLSGGLDSSSVICVASQSVADKKMLSAYSLVFDRLPCDEREFIEQTIRDVGVEHILTIPDKQDFDSSAWLQAFFHQHRDWPVQDIPSQAVWPLLNEAKQRGVRVMLTGVGGDHVTQGSPYYLADLLMSLRLATLARELKHYRFSRRIIFNWMLAPLAPEWLARFLDHRQYGASWERICNVPRSRFSSAAAWQEASFVIDAMTSVYLDGWWDALAVHGGLEFRHPFFDARLVDFLLKLPSEEKLWHGVTKIILRTAMKGILPESIRVRTGKAEFSPLACLALDSLKFDMQNSTFAHPGISKGRRAERLLNRRRAASPLQHSLHMWRVAGVEAWYESHVNMKGLDP